MHSQIVTVPKSGTRRGLEQSRGRGGIISRAASFPRLLPSLHLRSCSITSGLVIISARFSRRYGAASKFRKQMRSSNRSRRSLRSSSSRNSGLFRRSSSYNYMVARIITVSYTEKKHGRMSHKYDKREIFRLDIFVGVIDLSISVPLW